MRPPTPNPLLRPRRLSFCLCLGLFLFLITFNVNVAATQEATGESSQDAASDEQILLLGNDSASDLPGATEEPNAADVNGDDLDQCDSAKVIHDESGTWRQLDPEEGMPVGAHVRLDMSGCGTNYIKVDPSTLVVEEGNSNKLQIAEDPQVNLDKESQNGNRAGSDHAGDVSDAEGDFEEMERVLKELPEPDERLSEVAKLREEDPEAYERAVRLLWQRRQEELVKAFESLADEVQIMRDFLQVLVRHNSSEEELLYSLGELEAMVQSIDTAQDFAALEGLQVVAMKLIDENPRIRTNAAYVIGSACKLDHALQKRARELGVLALLHDQLERSWAQNTEESNAEAAKVLYAISALIRGSPENQQELATSSFVSILQKIVEAGWDDVGTRVRVKAVTLLDDVLHEDCEGMTAAPDIVVVPLGDSGDPGTAVDKGDEGCKTPLREAIDVPKLCNTVQDLLSRFAQRAPEGDTTFTEKLEALHTTAQCNKVERKTDV